VKLVHLVGFIIKKFVTMHGHVNVKLCLTSLLNKSAINKTHIFLVCKLYYIKNVHLAVLLIESVNNYYLISQINAKNIKD
jgi:hypothetical protein